MSDTPPLNVTQLNERLAQVAADLGLPIARARVVLCTLIVSQMLSDAVAVKGGMGVNSVSVRSVPAPPPTSMSRRVFAAQNLRACSALAW